MIPTHLSYSQYNSFTRCPRSWYLSKVRQAEEKQTWYIPIGSAVHGMIEEYLDPSLGPTLVTPERADVYFYPLIEKQMEIEPDLSKWMAGGPKDAPITHEKALQMVSECFERALDFLEDMDVWEVEYDASGRLPGLEVPIKAYIDIIGEHKKKGPLILDWKTGSTKPDNFQLETYAALMTENGYGHDGNMVAAWQGRYAMISPTYTSSTRYVDLSEILPEAVGVKYQAVYDQMEARLYRADRGFNCNYCFYQESCLAKAGPTEQAKYYDRAEQDGFPY